MKTKFFSFMLLSMMYLPFSITADIPAEIIPSYYVKETKRDSSLKMSEAVFVIQFFDERNKVIAGPVKFSCNGLQKTSVRNEEGKTSLKVKPGKYRFMFYHSSIYEEIITDSIEINPGYKSKLVIRFKSTLNPMPVKKPVIYLYPEKKQEISVKLDLEGSLGFCYPEYKNGWNVIADSTGSLTIGQRKYDYLFWEGNIMFKEADLSKKSGYVVKKENTIQFLEEKLSAMGLSGREQEDFITYWAPQMMKNEANFVHFLFNKEFNKYARIDIQPAPDQIFRLFMIWEKTNESIAPAPQIIQKINRQGFCVVEWGGTELSVERTNLH